MEENPNCFLATKGKLRRFIVRHG